MNIKNPLNLTIVLILLLISGLACSGFREIVPQQQTTTATPAPTASQTPAPDAESAKLKERISELEKKIEEKQKPTVVERPPTVIVKPPVPPVVRNSGNTAWVNSPGDGYLAMRSQPDAEIGSRILKIPHGAKVRVVGCQDYPEQVGGRRGRWCRVSYGGYTGWAFDGWLVYY